MTPFLQLRLWLRRAPAGERVGAFTVIAVVVLLAAWALVPLGATTTAALDTGAAPTGLPSAEAVASPGAAPGASVAGTNGAVRGGPVAGPAFGGGSPGAPGAVGGVPGSGVGPVVPSPARRTPTDRCGKPGSTDQGVTATQVHIDVTLADLQGQAGNSLVGIPSADTQKAMFEAALAQVNAEGGIRCRKVVAKYYKANPLDQQSLQAICLQIVADKPFALLDEGLGSPVGSPAPRDCPPGYKIPSFSSLSLGQAEIDKFAPYLFGYYPAAETTVHDSILGAKQLGWFTAGAKVGLLEQQCNPNLNVVALRDLASIGFPESEVTTFDFGCPNAIPSPSDVQAAVLAFQRAGVTHVLDDAGVYQNYFSKVAQAQAYHPKYMVGDQGTIALWSNPSFGPDPDNYDGSLAITGTRYGEATTAGLRRNAATSKCDRAMAAAGQPGAWESPAGFSGVVCSIVTMLVQGANNAPELRRDQIARGLASLATLDMPFPAGPAVFSAHKGQLGGGFWRPTLFHKDCRCFRVSRASFQKDFA